MTLKIVIFLHRQLAENTTFDQISDSENELFAAKTQHQFSEDQSEVYPKKSRLSQLLMVNSLPLPTIPSLGVSRLILIW